MAGLLGAARNGRPTLREMFEAGEMVLAPGCFDALGARLVEEKADGTPIELLPSMVGFDEFLQLVGIDEIRELEQRFAEG